MSDVTILSAAVVVAVLISKGGAKFAQSLRRASFAKQETREPSEFELFRDLAFLSLRLNGQEEAIRKSATNLLEEHHKEAIRLQDRYHDAISTAVTASLLGFLALAVTLTIAEGIDWVTKFCAALDVLCFALALWSFRQALRSNGDWINARTLNELLRQWCVFDNLLVVPPTSPDVTTRFLEFSSRVEAVCVPASAEPGGRDRGEASARQHDLVSRVAEFWKDRRRELEVLALARPILLSRLATHFFKRPLAQASWFDKSEHRLRGQSHLRSSAVAWAFVLTVLLSLFKLILVFHLVGGEQMSLKPLVSLGMLAMIGISSGLAALYLNQNTRSLIHRYEAQRRRIHDWLLAYQSVLAEIPVEASVVPVTLAARLVDSILKFESIMIDELIDWISISTGDVIELSAS